MTIKLSQQGGGGGVPVLAPDLSWPSSKIATDDGYKQITGINAVGSLTTALNLTGKHTVSFLRFTGLSAESMTFKLTVDSVVLWNDATLSAFTGNELLLLGSGEGLTASTFSEVYSCNESFLLEVQTTADPNIGLDYLARPVQ